MLEETAASDALKIDIYETNTLNPHQLVSAVDLREMFGGVTDMTISRWLKSDKLNFPKPIRIATRRYWYAVELITWIENQPRENSR